MATRAMVLVWCVLLTTVCGMQDLVPLGHGGSLFGMSPATLHSGLPDLGRSVGF